MNASNERKCDECGDVMPGESLDLICPKCVESFLFSPRATGQHGLAVDEGSLLLSGSLPSATQFQESDTKRIVGDYALLGEIARGAMGVVYQARQLTLGRLVAIKMISSGRLATEAERRRFRNEARAAAHLDHPNIVPIYEAGIYEGQNYFSMKLILGDSLARHIEDYAGRHEDAARLILKAARAVQHAHEKRILHRDLKPGNILVDHKGEPHIADFGLVSQIQSVAGAERGSVVVGTPGYMAPEQARSGAEPHTAASDVYGLGATLYELFTGEPPIRGKDTRDTMEMTVSTPPRPPRELAPTLRADLEAVCLKCLEKRPEDRYATAGELADAIQKLLPDELDKQNRRLRRVLAVTVLTICVAIAAIFFWPALDRDADGLPDRVEDANGNGEVDPGETDLTSADTDKDGVRDANEDSDYDGATNVEELTHETNMYDPEKRPALRLERISLRSDGWRGDRGTKPARAENLEVVGAGRARATVFDPAKLSLLAYEPARSDGADFINLRRGTVTMWIRPDPKNAASGVGWQTLLHIEPQLAERDFDVWALFCRDDGVQFAFDGMGNRPISIVTSAARKTDGPEWLFLAATYEPGWKSEDGKTEPAKMKLFLNGETLPLVRLLPENHYQLAEETDLPWETLELGLVGVGSDPDGALSFRGKIREIATYNYALSEAELRRLFKADSAARASRRSR